MIGTHVPDAARAVVMEVKVRDYLLAAEHPDNGGKAGFFARFGFSRLRWRDLHAALVMHLSDNVVIQASPAGGGIRVRVRCNLASPDGRNPCITTVWALDPGRPPSFITAFPGKPPPAP